MATASQIAKRRVRSFFNGFFYASLIPWYWLCRGTNGDTFSPAFVEIAKYALNRKRTMSIGSWCPANMNFIMNFQYLCQSSRLPSNFLRLMTIWIFMKATFSSFELHKRSLQHVAFYVIKKENMWVWENILSRILHVVYDSSKYLWIKDATYIRSNAVSRTINKTVTYNYFETVQIESSFFTDTLPKKILFSNK